MSKHDKNRASQGNVAAAMSQKKMGSTVTSIRSASNEAVQHSSPPVSAEQIIRRRAYELYEKRGCEDGHAEEDWLHAEAEVLGTVFRRARVG